MAAGFYFNILWRFDIRTKFLYGMAEEARIESVTEIVGGNVNLRSFASSIAAEPLIQKEKHMRLGE